MAAHSIIAKRIHAQILYTAGLLKPKPSSWRILMYHRVTTPTEVPYPFEPGMYVSPQTFRMHLAYLTDHFEVHSIDTLVSRVSSGESFARPVVAITFDDGMADNYRNAFPALREFQIPATIFLATSYIGTNRLFWSDALQALVASGFNLAPLRELLTKNTLTVASDLLNHIPREGDVLRELVSKVTRAVKTAPADIRNQVLSELAPLLAERERVVPRQFLTWEEASEMGKHGITFGSHTHTHRSLPELAEEALLADVAESLRLIREHQLPESKVFCYPGGYFNEATQKLLTCFNFSASLLTNRSLENTTPSAFSRMGIHEDMASTQAMFAKRIAS